VAAPAGGRVPVCCDFGFVTAAAATVRKRFDLRSIAEPEVGLARESGLSRWIPSLATGVDEASRGQNHLNHSGQSCAEASVAIAATAVSPAIMQTRTRIIASPIIPRERSVFAYSRSGAF
jgi:hypothetical protein